jgi:hypothetical protein
MVKFMAYFAWIRLIHNQKATTKNIEFNGNNRKNQEKQ